jgi:hypothetical protein
VLWLFDEAVARVAVVVNGVLRFQLLNISELALGMRAGDAIAERLASVQQDFFETTRQAHAFVAGQIMEQSGKTLFQSHRNLHALNFDGRPKDTASAAILQEIFLILCITD